MSAVCARSAPPAAARLSIPGMAALIAVGFCSAMFASSALLSGALDRRRVNSPNRSGRPPAIGQEKHYTALDANVSLAGLLPQFSDSFLP